MIQDLLYRCPVCGAFDWLEKDRCRSCGASFFMPTRSTARMNGETAPLSAWYAKTCAFDLPAGPDGFVMKSRRVRVSQESVSGLYKGFAGITAYHFTRAPLDTGNLTLSHTRLSFTGVSVRLAVAVEDIVSITIESNTLIVVDRRHGPLFFDFLEESGKMWEDLLRKVLVRHHAPEEIVEFYPRIRLGTSFKRHPATVQGHLRLRVPDRRWYRKDTSILETILKPMGRLILSTAFKIETSGMENIPSAGPAVLLANHTSFLDSVFLGFFIRRTIWFMAKNSEYRHPFMKWFLRHASTFPVRRYTTDVLAVRNAVRVVAGGHLLGIFPEGERSWDGSMLPIRTGTVRLVLALGVPVVPVGIRGAYEIMPRWTHSIRRTSITLNAGRPLVLPHIPIPAQTASDIADASRTIASELERLARGNT